MKILFLVHHTFSSQAENLSWLKQIHFDLVQIGLEISFFESDKHKISDFSVIHLFGFGHFELLYNMKKSDHKILCTPSKIECPQRNKSAKLCQRVLQLIHILKQRKLVPFDMFSMVKSFDSYVLNQSTSNSWRENWDIPNNKVNEFNFSAKEFPKALAELYKELKS